MKSPHHSLPKPTAETFFFVLKLSNPRTQILDQLGLFFYPHKLPFSFPTNWHYNKVPPHSTCPCFRLHRERVQKESCGKNNCAPTGSQFLSKEIQHTNLGFAYFCGVEDNFPFPSMLPKHTHSHTQGRRALTGKTMLAESPPHSRCLPPIPASAARFTHWNPPTCFLPALN